MPFPSHTHSHHLSAAKTIATPPPSTDIPFTTNPCPLIAIHTRALFIQDAFRQCAYTQPPSRAKRSWFMYSSDPVAYEFRQMYSPSLGKRNTRKRSHRDIYPRKKIIYQRGYHHLHRSNAVPCIYSIIIWCGEGETVRQTAAAAEGFVTNGGRENGTVKGTVEENTQIKCLSNGFLLRSYNDSRQLCAILYIYLNYDPCVAHRYRTLVQYLRLCQCRIRYSYLFFFPDDLSSEHNW